MNKEYPTNYFEKISKRIVVFLSLFLLLIGITYGVGQPTIIALQGKITNETTGAVISSADLRVNVTNTDGTTLWNETFTNGVSNGFFDLLLGTNVNNPLNLTFNQDYNVSIYFGDSSVQIGGTYRFRGGQGLINPSNVSAGNFTAPGNFSFGSAMYVDKTNDRIGIGTTSPNSLLHVAGTTPTIRIQDGSNTGFYLQQGSGAAYVWNPDSNALLFGTNNIERVRIVSEGNIGVGNTAPAEKVVVAGNISMTTTAGETVYVGSGGTNGDIRPQASGGAQIGFSRTSDSDDEIQFLTHDSGVSHDVRMVINGSGSVGIGVSNPSKIFEVSNAIDSIVVDPSAEMPTINTSSPGGNAKNITVASEDGSVIIQLG